MKKTAVAALFVLAVCGLSACSTPDKTPPPAASPTAAAPAKDVPESAPIGTGTEQQADVAKAATRFLKDLYIEGQAFAGSQEVNATKPDLDAAATFFAKSLDNVKKDSFTSTENIFRAFATTAAKMPPVTDPRKPFYDVSNPSAIVVDGSKATVPVAAFENLQINDGTTMSFVLDGGRWLLDGSKYDDDYFAFGNTDDVPKGANPN